MSKPKHRNVYIVLRISPFYKTSRDNTHTQISFEIDLIGIFHKIEGPRETSLHLHVLTFELRPKQLVVIHESRVY